MVETVEKQWSFFFRNHNIFGSTVGVGQNGGYNFRDGLHTRVEICGNCGIGESTLETPTELIFTFPLFNSRIGGNDSKVTTVNYYFHCRNDENNYLGE